MPASSEDENPGVSARDRSLGCLLGLACGDAVGTTVEFQGRGTFPPVTDMVGGGPFGLAPGEWTDDTSMALCLAQSLLACGGFDPSDQMDRYVAWWQRGHLSSTGTCFDIGNTVAAALTRFLRTGEPFAGSVDPRTAGNGSLMRLAPVVLYFRPDHDAVVRFAVESSRTTHGAPEALECCALFGSLLDAALDGLSKNEVLGACSVPLREHRVAALAKGAYRDKPSDEIRGSGYCVESLEAALWCFAQTETFEDAVLAAANLGDDADTTAALVGQLAGAHYGVGELPRHWLDRLCLRDLIEQTANELHDAKQGPA